MNGTLLRYHKCLSKNSTELNRSEAPCSKLRGIRNKTKRNCAGAGYPPSPRLRRGHLALRPHSKLWGIRAEASEKGKIRGG